LPISALLVAVLRSEYGATQVQTNVQQESIDNQFGSSQQFLLQIQANGLLDIIESQAIDLDALQEFYINASQLLGQSLQEYIANVAIVLDIVDDGIWLETTTDTSADTVATRGFNGEWYINTDMCYTIVGSALLGAYGFGAGLLTAILAGWVSSSVIATGIAAISGMIALMAPWMITALSYILAKVGVFAINLVEAMIRNKGVAITYTLWGAVPTGSYVR
jgi:hypothetical protein